MRTKLYYQTKEDFKNLSLKEIIEFSNSNKLGIHVNISFRKELSYTSAFNLIEQIQYFLDLHKIPDCNIEARSELANIDDQEETPQLFLNFWRPKTKEEYISDVLIKINNRNVAFEKNFVAKEKRRKEYEELKKEFEGK